MRGGAWNPDRNEDHRAQRDALAARGYWQACQVVRRSVRRVLDGENPGTVAEEDHGTWFPGAVRARGGRGVSSSPSILPGTATLPSTSGARCTFRRTHEAVRDAMPTFFDLLCDETEPSVRVVLGHFMFGLHSSLYGRATGRVGRFLMNVMLAAGGYPWTVIPVERRDAYMAALEDASVRQDIGPFTDFLAELVSDGLAGKPAAGLPC